MNEENAFTRYKEYILAHKDLLEPYFGKRDDEEAFLLWSSYFRRILMDAQFVLGDLYPDVAAYREMSAKVAVSGLSGFRKGGPAK